MAAGTVGGRDRREVPRPAARDAGAWRRDKRWNGCAALQRAGSGRHIRSGRRRDERRGAGRCGRRRSRACRFRRPRRSRPRPDRHPRDRQVRDARRTTAQRHQPRAGGRDDARAGGSDRRAGAAREIGAAVPARAERVPAGRERPRHRARHRRGDAGGPSISSREGMAVRDRRLGRRAAAEPGTAPETTARSIDVRSRAGIARNLDGGSARGTARAQKWHRNVAASLQCARMFGLEVLR